MKVIRLADTGEWLKAYDPDGGDQGIAYPTGIAEWTRDPSKAILFASAAEAFELWRRTSRRTPRRPDGRPNRPLSAFTISVEDA